MARRHWSERSDSNPPTKTAGYAARACSRSAFQFQGRSLCRRVCGRSAMRSRTSAGQACRWTLSSLAVPMRVYIPAARAPSRSEPANSHDFLPSAITRRRPLGAVVGLADAAAVGEAGEPVPALEHLGQRAKTCPAPRQFVKRRPRRRYRLAVPACELLAHRMDRFPPARDHPQGLRDILAHLGQPVQPTTFAGRGRQHDHALARPMGPAAARSAGYSSSVAESWSRRRTSRSERRP